MSSTFPKIVAVLLAGSTLLAAPLPAAAGTVAPDLARLIAARAPGDVVPVIVEVDGKLDPSAYAVRDRRLRDTRLFLALRSNAARILDPLRALVEALGAKEVKPLWITHALAARVPAGAVGRVAVLPGVRLVRLDAAVQGPITTLATSATPEWNLGAIHAPDLWSLGLSGAGVVVANMDTGVDALHPDLAGRWRGGTNGWYDPYGQHASPHDPNGHGTQTMGIMVGGSAGGTAIGVAPDARWIAAKIFDDSGQGTLSAIHLAFQWLLDPDGDPLTLDAPDVVNGSWSILDPPGTCNLEFRDDVLALEAAGVGVVFAAGNEGPVAGTSSSPANNPGGFSTGAVDSTSTVAWFSSRGPSACDGSIFPTLAAPGVDVWTSDLSWGGFPSYAVVSGTSFAAPHVAGAMALLAGAAPAASVAELRSALVQGALDLGPAGADDAYGHGLTDVAAAYARLSPGAGSPPTITSAPITTASEGSLYVYQVTATDPDGDAITFSLDTAPAGMTIGASSGIVSWTPGAAQVGSHAVAVRAADASGLAATQSFGVTVSPANRAPTAAGDGYSATAGVTLGVAAPGVLGNDADPDGDPLTAVLASGPAHGTLTLGANGSFSYTASAGYAGADAFTYTASDGELSSAPATVTITVVAAQNQPPVAANDAFTAPYRSAASYTPRILAVLANDGDPDGSLAPSSVRITSAPNKGGIAKVNADGTVSYTPKRRFRGTETFGYDVKDDQGATSNAATVTVTVK